MLYRYSLLIASSLDSYAIAIGYLLAASIIPLFVDVAEELFVSSLARIDRTEVLRFNIALYSLIGFVGFLARPLGAILAGVAIGAALLLNLCASLIGLGLRVRAVRSIPRGWLLSTVAVDADAEWEPEPDRPSVTVAGSGGPSVAFFLGCSNGVLAGYLGLWIARSTTRPSTWITLSLIGSGLGATAGPYLARLERRLGGYAGALRAMIVGRLVLLAVIGAVVNVGRRAEDVAIAGAMVCALAILTGVVVAASVLQATARQSEYSGRALARIVGWSHAFSAGGTLMGGWIGLLLSVDRAPTGGVAVSAVMGAIALPFVVDHRKSRTTCSTG